MKKGQAAMEFLMTYGWAILVVIAAIAALAYFGVLSPSKMLPERCTGESGMDCLMKPVFDASTNNVSFVMKNNQGFDINITDISSTANDGCTATGYTITPQGGSPITDAPVKLSNGKSATVEVHCSDTLSGRASANFLMTYHDYDNGFTQKASYDLKGNAR